MTIMQGHSAVIWEWITIGMLVLSSLAIWFVTIIGRDEKPSKQKRGGSTIEYYGDIGEDRSPVGKFLKITYIGLAVWAVVYALIVGIHGFF